MAKKIAGIVAAEDLQKGDEFQFAGSSLTVIETTIVGLANSAVRIEAASGPGGFTHIHVGRGRMMEILR